jgi:hypothetical protein
MFLQFGITLYTFLKWSLISVHCLYFLFMFLFYAYNRYISLTNAQQTSLLEYLVSNWWIDPPHVNTDVIKKEAMTERRMLPIVEEILKSVCVCVYDSVSIGSADSRHPLNIAPLPPTRTTPAAEQDWRVTEVSTVPHTGTSLSGQASRVAVHFLPQSCQLFARFFGRPS